MSAFILNNDYYSRWAPSIDSVIVYVDSVGGDNANDGLSPEAPKQTLAAAYALTLSGRPDQIRCRRGSNFNESLSVARNGRNWFERFVIRDYGPQHLPRPVISPPLTTQPGIDFVTGSVWSYIAVQGIKVENCGDGISSHNVFALGVEDCMVDGASQNGMSFEIGGSGISGQPVDFVQVRRCVIQNCQDNGIYIEKGNDNLIEDCVFYNNGLGDNELRHNLYASGDVTDPCERLIVRRNFFLKAGGNYGLKIRTLTDCLIEHNFFAQNRNCIDAECDAVGETMSGIVRHNVFVDSWNPDEDTGVRGIDLASVQDFVVHDNILVGSPDSNGNPCIHFQMPTGHNAGNSGDAWPTNSNVDITDNIIYGWEGAAFSFANRDTGLLGYSDVVISGNDVQAHASGYLVEHFEPPTFGSGGVSYSGGRYDPAGGSPFGVAATDGGGRVATTLAQWQTDSGDNSTATTVSYTDPTRDSGSWCNTLGLGTTFGALVTAALAQERSTWNEALDARAAVNYVRAGFDKAAV